MAIVYRTAGAWGAGKGSNLTPAEVDGNFYDHEQRIVFIEDHPPTAVSISAFEVSGDQLSVVLTNGMVVGPYTLPSLAWNFRGQWLPSTTYAKFDIATYGGAVYLVPIGHISGATFDPHATDGSGHDLYQLLITALRGSPVATAAVSSAGTWHPVVGDEFKFWVFAEAAFVVLPSNAEQPFAIGDEITVWQDDGSTAGNIAIEWPTDVTVKVPAGFLPELLGDGATATLKKIATDKWALMGLLKSA